MLSHVHIGTNAFGPAVRFYTKLFAILGHRLRFEDREREWAGWQPQGAERPLFLVGRPFDGAPATAGNGQMLALQAKSRAEVDRCHATTLTEGGACEGAPGLRPHYHPHYYGAYVRDLDGNKLCICCHDPE